METPSQEAIQAAARRLLDLQNGINAVPEVVALGPAAVPHLEALLCGPPESIFQARCLVAETLGMIGGAAAADALLRALNDSLGRTLGPVLQAAGYGGTEES